MAAPKGHPRYGGRTKGTPNKRTREMLDATRAAREKARRVLGEDAFDGDAHALLCMVYRDTTLPLDVRLDAAKFAIGYEVPKLQAALMAAVDPRGGVLSPEVLAAQKAEAHRQAMRAFDEAFGLVAESEPSPSPSSPPAPPVLIAQPEPEPSSEGENPARQAGFSLEQREEKLRQEPGPLGTGRPREYAREGNLAADPSVARTSPRPRPPRPLGNWSG